LAADRAAAAVPPAAVAPAAVAPAAVVPAAVVPAAVVLAGGQARRLGGVDKPAIEIGGRSLLAGVVRAASLAGARQIVVVGPPRAGLGVSVSCTLEERPGGGPVPALRAGLALVTEPWSLLLAADLPFLSERGLRMLIAAPEAEQAGAVMVDAAGRSQWLMSCWRTTDLRAGLDSYAGNSLHGLLAKLPHAQVAAPDRPGERPSLLDCDTPDDVAAARQWASRPDLAADQ
jgi:molybdopterin-guanine dinucleotide biosynthesis protein A